VTEMTLATTRVVPGGISMWKCASAEMHDLTASRGGLHLGAGVISTIKSEEAFELAAVGARCPKSNAVTRVSMSAP
jgi:hypothetical protein